jgi:hypothetical protein
MSIQHVLLRLLLRISSKGVFFGGRCPKRQGDGTLSIDLAIVICSLFVVSDVSSFGAAKAREIQYYPVECATAAQRFLSDCRPVGVDRWAWTGGRGPVGVDRWAWTGGRGPVGVDRGLERALPASDGRGAWAGISVGVGRWARTVRLER